MKCPNNCVTLTKLSGPFHKSGKNYYCMACGEHYRVERWEVSIEKGTKPLAEQPKQA